MDAHKQGVKLRKLKITPTKQKLSETQINENIMNMLKQKTNGHFGALNEDFLLWSVLENNPPQWWKNLLDDKELYVEIRKDNYANVYYYGGNVALVRWTGGEIATETHQKYLGESDETATYQDCIKQLLSKDGIEDIKGKIREEYHKLSPKKEANQRKGVYTSSEKWVQGELKLCFPNRYIDSEFAYRTGEKELIRFDLVELRENKKLVFIELKLITDPRLRSKEGEPEIIEQMTEYCKFINKHTKELKDYYSKLLRIKKRTNLWNGETEIEEVSLKPELLIVNTYEKLTKGREERITYMENLKERTDFDTLIVDYPDLCK
ncbi:MAG: hypothetical protein K2J84_00465 [Bacteroidaceae bacterium]|nr:hypothetical protein [Bacteroidaceae bacterium]